MLQRLTALLVLAAASVAIGASVGTTAKAPVATASAYGITIVVPGQAGASAAVVQAPGPALTGVADAFAFPADGSIVRTGALSSSVSSRATAAPAAHAVTDVLTGSLFNGEITWESAAARAKSTGPSSDAVGSAVTGLVVLGQPVGAAPNQRHALGDWGFLVTLERGRRLEGRAHQCHRAPRHPDCRARRPAPRNGDPDRARRRRDLGADRRRAGDEDHDNDDGRSQAAGRARRSAQAQAGTTEAPGAWARPAGPPKSGHPAAADRH